MFSRRDFQSCSYFIAGMALMLLAAGTARAHGDLHQRIEDLSVQIQTHPTDMGLYLERAELNRLHANWDAALRDYESAERLVPAVAEMGYYKGRVWAEAGCPDRARPLLDRFLATHPTHVEALLVRSDVLEALGHKLLAAEDLGVALAQTDSPGPELYLSRAVLLVSADDSQVDEALATIDHGIARLGPLITLIQFAFETELARNRFQAALGRIEQLPIEVQEAPTWLKRRGDVLRALERRQEAREVYFRALAKIQDLPDSRRSSQAIYQLESSLRELTSLD